MLLEARRLSVSIGRRFLLYPTDVAVSPGEWKGIVGPNGAGKSTMLKAIAGLMPRRGDMRWLGRPIDDDPIGFRRSVGVLFHEHALYRQLTARENLMFAARLWYLRDRDDLVSRWLDVVDLSFFADEKVGRFSQGMTQRLALARALMTDPQLLLLDEPLAGIDASGEAIIMDVFSQAKNDGVAALWVTHRYEKARSLVDEMVEIDGGHVVRRTPRTDPSWDDWSPKHVVKIPSGANR